MDKDQPAAITPSHTAKTPTDRTARSTPRLKRPEGLANELSSPSSAEKSACDTAREPPQHKLTLDALRAGGLFGKSKDGLKGSSKSTRSNLSKSSPGPTSGCSTAKTIRSKKSVVSGRSIDSVGRTPRRTAGSMKTAKSNRSASLNTAITPNGLSCKTAKTIRTMTPKSVASVCQKKSSSAPSKKVESSELMKKKKQPRNQSRDSAVSCTTGKSFQPPGTPYTCVEILPHVLAEAKAEQNKVSLTASSADKSFKVIMTLKMKIVGQNKDPQALTITKVTVNGEERYSV